MSHKISLSLAGLLATIFLLGLTGHAGASQSTAITYQGNLVKNGDPVTGAFDFIFTLHSDPDGNSAVGSTVIENDVAVENGVFTAMLDFGADAFDGDRRWLQIEVGPTGEQNFTTLSPLQELTPAPYSHTAFDTAGTAEDRLEALEEALGDVKDTNQELTDTVAALEAENESLYAQLGWEADEPESFDLHEPLRQAIAEQIPADSFIERFPGDMFAEIVEPHLFPGDSYDDPASIDALASELFPGDAYDDPASIDALATQLFPGDAFDDSTTVNALATQLFPGDAFDDSATVNALATQLFPGDAFDDSASIDALATQLFPGDAFDDSTTVNALATQLFPGDAFDDSATVDALASELFPGDAYDDPASIDALATQLFPGDAFDDSATVNALASELFPGDAYDDPETVLVMENRLAGNIERLSSPLVGAMQTGIAERPADDFVISMRTVTGLINLEEWGPDSLERTEFEGLNMREIFEDTGDLDSRD